MYDKVCRCIDSLHEALFYLERMRGTDDPSVHIESILYYIGKALKELGLMIADLEGHKVQPVPGENT